MNAGRSYVVSPVCLQIYNAEGELIRMMPISQAKKVYPELFEPKDAPGALSQALGEIKLNKSHER